ncbi:hypothetical protein [Streptomyces sp. NPDC093109]|uniref:hypothetical protein n=1 Tax=Streptomyces sp. NPDC093109 TaxID=3154977 RepID=UPI00344E709F
MDNPSRRVTVCGSVRAVARVSVRFAPFARHVFRGGSVAVPPPFHGRSAAR